MKGEREAENQYNSNSIVMMSPSLQEGDEEIRGVVTHQAGRGKPEQKVSDCCGKLVGRVP